MFPQVAWHSFDLRTGRRGPRLETQTLGTISRNIGAETETTLSVRCWDQERQAPQVGFEEGTLPGRTIVAALTEDDAEMILWAGMVYQRHDTGAAYVDVNAMTLESYLNRRFVGNFVTSATSGFDQAAIAYAIVLPTIGDGAHMGLDLPSTGVLQYRTYAITDDKTVLSALQELASVINGLEWTVDLGWSDASHTVMQPVFRGRVRLGTAAPNPVVFDMPGCVTAYDYTEDFSSENGANDVLATSSGQGGARPQSDHQVASDHLANGWVRFEKRFQPATAITDIATLNTHAAKELGIVEDGVNLLGLTAALDDAPRLGTDWWIGDDIVASITSPRFPARTGPDGDTIPGLVKRMRCTGWTMDLDARTVSPTMTQTTPVV